MPEASMHGTIASFRRRLGLRIMRNSDIDVVIRTRQ